MGFGTEFGIKLGEEVIRWSGLCEWRESKWGILWTLSGVKLSHSRRGRLNGVTSRLLRVRYWALLVNVVGRRCAKVSSIRVVIEVHEGFSCR